MHYMTYGFFVFGIIQLVTALICLIRPSIVLTPELCATIEEKRKKSAKRYFALRIAIFALFGIAFVILASPLVPDQMAWHMRGTRTWTSSSKAPWLWIPLVLELLALFDLNKHFTGRIFATEGNDFPARKWLYAVSACIAVAAVLLWNIPSTVTAEKTMPALVIEDGEVVGETTVTLDFTLRDYLFREYDECEGDFWVGEQPENTYNEYYSAPHRFDYEYNGEKVTVYDVKYNFFAENDYHVSFDANLTFLMTEDADMLWIETSGDYYAVPRSYVAYDGSYAEAAVVFDMLANHFNTESFVGLPTGHNPFR